MSSHMWSIIIPDNYRVISIQLGYDGIKAALRSVTFVPSALTISLAISRHATESERGKLCSLWRAELFGF